MSHYISRRSFLKYSGAAAATLAIPFRSTAFAANSKLRTAFIGVGGMQGMSDLNAVASHAGVEVAALCDIDSGYLATAGDKFPEAKRFYDYREMIDQLGDTIDGVVISAPDHTHAPAAMTALNANKPVYCQKPLTHEAFESRQLRLVSEAKGLSTQMGIQIHSYPQYRRVVRMIQDGVIGKVSAVHAWTVGSWGYDGPNFTNQTTPPDSVKWDLWLGTAAEREYVPEVYHPINWRKLVDFGTATIGDLAVHIFDTPYDALQLTAPTWVKNTCKKQEGIGHPVTNRIEFEFPGSKYTTDTVQWTWRDGEGVTPDPVEFGLPAGTNLPRSGSLFIGEGGQLLLPHFAECTLFPEEKFKDYQRPEVETQDHYHQWVDSCFGKTKTTASFSFGGPLTEALLLGVVASRYPQQRLYWNAEDMKFTNNTDADQYLRRTYRKGFEVENL